MVHKDKSWGQIVTVVISAITISGALFAAASFCYNLGVKVSTVKWEIDQLERDDASSAAELKIIREHSKNK